MSLYQKLKANPPKLVVVENAREVIINAVSSMCDNKYEFRLKKNSEGDFKMSTGRFSFRNFGFEHNRSEFEWTADEGNWDKVFNMINKGYVQIEKVRSR